MLPFQGQQVRNDVLSLKTTNDPQVAHRRSLTPHPFFLSVCRSSVFGNRPCDGSRPHHRLALIVFMFRYSLSVLLYPALVNAANASATVDSRVFPLENVGILEVDEMVNLLFDFF